ncbi:hypothetical protein EOD39_8793, partial [Acipenser ruthenus]
NNLTRKEKNALKDFESDPSIIIKPADKGGGIVVQKKVDYIRESQRQLLDSNFYKKLEFDPTNQVKENVTFILQSYVDQGEITKKEYDFLAIKFPRIPFFY